ncbi:MAG: PAS domain S-box protein [Spartobacteria bacterium]|nr:PAS domain S-box protein [Spartobacteria bacterium]
MWSLKKTTVTFPVRARSARGPPLPSRCPGYLPERSDMAHTIVKILFLSVGVALAALLIIIGFTTHHELLGWFDAWGYQNALTGSGAMQILFEDSVNDGTLTREDVFFADFASPEGAGRSSDIVQRTRLHAVTLLDSFLENPLIRYVGVVRADGYVPYYIHSATGVARLADGTPVHEEEMVTAHPKQPHRFRVERDGKAHLEYCAPLYVDLAYWGYFYVGMAKAHVYAYYRAQILRLVALLFLAFIIIFGCNYWIIRRHIRRLRELNRITDEMTSGNLDVRCDISGQDEVAELGRSLNIMIQTIKVSYDTMESRIRDRTDALNLIIDSNPAGILLIDAETRAIVRANEAACEMMGYSADDVFMMSCSQVFCREKGRCPVLSEGRTTDYAEYELIKADGTKLPVLKSVVVLSIEGRKHLLETFTDLSQQHNAACALRDNLLFLQTLIDTIPNPIYYKDVHGIHLGANQAFSKLISDKSVNNFSELLTDEFAGLEATKDREVMQTKRPIHYDGQIRCTDGSLRDFYFSKALFYDTGGNLGGIVTVMQDITERKQTEEMLRTLSARREALENIVNHSPTIAFLWKAEEGWPVEYVSENISHMGYSPKELLSGDVPFSRLVHPDDLLHIAEEVAEYTRNGIDRFTQEYRMLTKEGLVRWVDDRTWVRRDENANVTHYQGVLLDITEKKNIETELLRIRSAIDDASDSIIVTNTKGTPLYCNHAFELLSGYRLPSLKGLSLETLFLESAQVAEMIGAMSREEIRQAALTVLASNGMKIPVQVRGSVVTDRLSNIEGMTFILSDLRKQNEQERNQKMMEAQLRQAQKMEAIGQLAAGIAHEINTPVQFIGDNTHFIEDAFADIATLTREYEKLLAAAEAQAVEPDLTGAIEKIKSDTDIAYLQTEIPRAIQQSLDGIRRIAEIVKAMKEFSHPGGGEKNAVDINHAIESTVTVARNEWKYVADVETDFDETLGQVLCLPGEFNQVILNILVNAAHAIGEHQEKQPDGKGAIRIATQRIDGWAEIRISDTGGGIPEHARERVFDPFYTTKEVGRGTGQGLYIAYDVIVNKHGGQLDFETKSGVGTTFIIRLPMEENILENPLT